VVSSTPARISVRTAGRLGSWKSLPAGSNREILDTLEVLWLYPGGMLVTFSQYNANAALAALKGAGPPYVLREHS